MQAASILGQFDVSLDPQISSCQGVAIVGVVDVTHDVPRADVAVASGLPSSLHRIDCTATVASHGQQVPAIEIQ